MNLDLHKIKSLTFITIVFIIFTTICAGILFVFVYSKELFVQTDTLKLLLLSFAITTPFWILNSFITSLFDNRDEPNVEENFQLYGLFGSILTIPVIYTPIVIKIFKDISLQVGILSAVSMELLIIIILIFSELKSKKNKK
mgnify:CR=1 FL=1|jgi:hypothetical protein